MLTNGDSIQGHCSLYSVLAMGRAPCCDKDNVKRGLWSPEEDEMLKSYIQTHGTSGNWIALPKKAGLSRCGKSCRLRWLNYLRPDIKHGGFTEEEDNIICTLYAQMGSRWSAIASNLPGRTDNDVKNYWNTKLKKKVLAGNVSLKLLNQNNTFLPPTTTSPIQDIMTQNHASSQIQNPPLPSMLPILDNNNFANSGFNKEGNMGFDHQHHLMDHVVSEIGASSRNINSKVSLLSHEGSSNVSDSSNNKKCLSLPQEHDGDVEMIDFGFGFPYDHANSHYKVGEFTTPSYYCYPGDQWVDFDHQHHANC